MIRFLKDDYTGVASGIEYGKKGDEVELIKIEGEMALVKGKELFHIRNEKLSETKQELTDQPIKDEIKKQNSEPKKNSPRKAVKQNKLF